MPCSQVGTEGAKVIAIGEWNGWLYNENGIDLVRLEAYRREHGTMLKFPDAETFEEPPQVSLRPNGAPPMPEAVDTPLDAEGVAEEFEAASETPTAIHGDDAFDYEDEPIRRRG